MRRAFSLALLLIAICSTAVALSRSKQPAAATAPSEALLAGSSRKPPVRGWTVVHLSGSPAQIGYTQGYLLAHEIADPPKVFLVELTHDPGKDWNFYRAAAKM